MNSPPRSYRRLLKLLLLGCGACAFSSLLSANEPRLIPPPRLRLTVPLSDAERLLHPERRTIDACSRFLRLAVRLGHSAQVYEAILLGRDIRLELKSDRTYSILVGPLTLNQEIELQTDSALDTLWEEGASMITLSERPIPLNEDEETLVIPLSLTLEDESSTSSSPQLQFRLGNRGTTLRPMLSIGRRYRATVTFRGRLPEPSLRGPRRRQRVNEGLQEEPTPTDD